MFDPVALGEKVTRDELTRVFDVCASCRRCVDVCDVFPTLFDLVDAVGGRAGQLTPAQQDDVVDRCVHCRRCVIDCPHTAGAADDRDVDIPRVMVRATAMRSAAGQLGWSHRRWVHALRRPRRLRRSIRLAGSVAPGAVRRHVARLVGGLSATRRAPAPRPTPTGAAGHGVDRADASATTDMVIVPTCSVAIARPDLVELAGTVLTRRGVGCTVVDIGCCGAPSLHAGDPVGFARAARRTFDELEQAQPDVPLVVMNPTCAATIRHEYPRILTDDGLDTATGRVVTTSAAVLHAAGSASGTGSAGSTPVTLHRSGHDQWLGRDDDADLLERIGCDIRLVHDSAGVESPAAYGTIRDDAVAAQAARLGRSLDALDSGTVVAGCVFAHPAIAEVTGVDPRHPLELVDEFDRARGLA